MALQDKKRGQGKTGVWQDGWELDHTGPCRPWPVVES